MERDGHLERKASKAAMSRKGGASIHVDLKRLRCTGAGMYCTQVDKALGEVPLHFCPSVHSVRLYEMLAPGVVDTADLIRANQSFRYCNDRSYTNSSMKMFVSRRVGVVD